MEVKSAYASKFKNVSEDTFKKFTLRNNLIIVERLDQDDAVKTESGIYIPTKDKAVFNGVTANSLEYHLVVAVGEGYESDDEDGTLDPELLECKVGDVVVLPTGAIQYISYFGENVDTEGQDKIGLARSSDCFIVFDGTEGFNQFFKEFK